MVKKALMLLGVLAIVGVAGLSLMLPDTVNANGHSATRSFVTDSVAAGGELEVTLEVAGLGVAGSVTETIPDGFTFLRSDENVNVDGQDLIFTILGGETTFNYTVTAGAAGTHQFSGTVKDFEKEERAVGGASSVNVTGPAGPMAERSFSASAVDPGANVTVTLNSSDYGAAGSIAETLPEGFSYVSSSLSESSVTVSGQTVTFTILGDDTFTYSVAASSSAGDHAFSGMITSFDRLTGSVGGDDSVTVNPPAPPMASRSFPAAFVDPGSEVMVTLSVSGYGPSGLIEETIPEGFAYQSTNLLGGAVEVSGQTVSFILLGEDSITYTVTAPDETEVYTFAGVLKDIDKMEVAIGGDSELRVGDPAPMFLDSESGVRSIAENTASGVSIGAPVGAASTAGPLTFEITSAAADTFDIDAATGQISTKGALDYEARASYSLQVTVTNALGDSASIVLTIQVTDVDEPVEPEPTVAPEPTATPRPTAPPATATATPEPTAPPEATATPEPTPEPPAEDDGGFPVWAIVVIVIAAVAGAGAIGYVVYRRRMA